MGFSPWRENHARSRNLSQRPFETLLTRAIKIEFVFTFSLEVHTLGKLLKPK